MILPLTELNELDGHTIASDFSMKFGFPLKFTNHTHFLDYESKKRLDFQKIPFAAFLLVMTTWCISWWIVSTRRNTQHSTCQFDYVGSILLTFGSVCPGWLLLLAYTSDQGTGTSPENWFTILLLRFFRPLECCFILSSVASVGLYLMTLNTMDPLKIGCLFVVSVSPLVVQLLGHTCQFRVVFLSWAISVGFSLASFRMFPFITSVPCAIIVGYMCYEIERRSIAQYFIMQQRFSHQQVPDLTPLSPPNEEIVKQKVYYRIISSVSHDLLTPIHALSVGMDTMGSLLADEFCKDPDNLGRNPRPDIRSSPRSRSVSYSSHSGSISKESFGRLTPGATSISELQLSMKGTVGFMSMIVHRYIDAFQAVGGTALKPHYDDFDIVSSISEISDYVVCMQSRIHIRVSVLKNRRGTIVCTDKRWFEDNILCMLGNAVKYSTGDTVELKAGLNNLKHDSGTLMPMLTVEVVDSGEAMAEERRNRLFSKPDVVDRELVGGFGLGLFSMSERVRALGGTVGSRPRDDGLSAGSVFWFSIPIKTYTSISVKSVRENAAAVHTEETVGAFRESLPVASHNEVISLVSSIHSRQSFILKLFQQSDRNSMGDGSLQNTGAVDDLLLQQFVEVEVDPVEDIIDKTAGNLLGYIKVATPSMRSHDTSTREPIRDPAVLSVQRPAPPSGISMKILVVDDSISIMKIMSMSLDRAGHAVDQAMNGAIALEKMKKQRYNVVLMDLQMPVMGGCEAARLYRAHEREAPLLEEFEQILADPLAAILSEDVLGHRLLIIGMSANIDAAARHEALSSGMDAFLPKPFSTDAMMKIVKERRMPRIDVAHDLNSVLQEVEEVEKDESLPTLRSRSSSSFDPGGWGPLSALSVLPFAREAAAAPMLPRIAEIGSVGSRNPSRGEQFDDVLA